MYVHTYIITKWRRGSCSSWRFSVAVGVGCWIRERSDEHKTGRHSSLRQLFCDSCLDFTWIRFFSSIRHMVFIFFFFFSAGRESGQPREEHEINTSLIDLIPSKVCRERSPGKRCWTSAQPSSSKARGVFSPSIKLEYVRHLVSCVSTKFVVQSTHVLAPGTAQQIRCINGPNLKHPSWY